MSDFVPCDILPDLWEEILRRHWTFLETEESLQKLEERKKLEGCLKEFLCIVPHDRKFFLPETGYVLRKTILELNEFTAHKAMIGFETVSRYANNLFTKPWRKEFRVLRTYSGCYQHEVKAHLLDAERLFLAMGYRRTSEDTFVLDGPICPDQVTNVSRDAMAAYVECQIMKHIRAGLDAAGILCSWQDIFHHRERRMGGCTQAIKELAHKLQVKHVRKDKALVNENTYSNVDEMHTQDGINRGDKYGTISHPQQQVSKNSSMAACVLHGAIDTNVAVPTACARHPRGSSHNLGYLPNDGTMFLSSHSAIPMTAQNQLQYNVMHAPMLHSHSMDHYNEPHLPVSLRRSFDHQPGHMHHYETPYDCLDGLSMGSSSVSHAPVRSKQSGAEGYNNYAHPYNAPGNRYPLPYNISSQLNAHYASPADNILNSQHNVYASIDKPSTHTCNSHSMQPKIPPLCHNSMTTKTSAPMEYTQNTYPPDQHLIDFDDRAQLLKHDYNAHGYGPKGIIYGQRPIGHASFNVGYDVRDTLPTTLPQPPGQDMYIYAQPVPKSSRTRPSTATGTSTNLTDKYARNMELMQRSVDNNRTMHKELKERSSASHGQDRRRMPESTSDVTSYESASLDGFETFGHDSSRARSPPLIPKVQEGVGSFESWNYVFKNLERSGYSKDLGDREDLLVQSLDLDSLTLANAPGGGIEKRRTINIESHLNNEKSRTLDKASTKREQKSLGEKAPATSTPSTSTLAPLQSKISGTKKIKSALKTATIDNRGSRSNTGTIAKHPLPVSTQLIVTSPNEWSCRFCTFLNPDTKRICEMCCRSKDFNLEAAASVSHASSTCV